MGRFLCQISLLVALASGTAATQPVAIQGDSARASVSEVSPSKRQVADHASIYLPITRFSIAQSLDEIAAASHVLVGFEAVADPGEPVDPPRHSRAWDVRGMRVSQALDMLTGADDRYGWREIDGVINVRPKATFDDPKHFLHRRVSQFTLRDAIPLQATFAVHRIFKPACRFAHPIYGDADERDAFIAQQPLFEQLLVTFEARNTTVLHILNGVIRAHGALHWNVSYPPYQFAYDTTYEHSNFAFTSVPQSGGWWRMCD